VLGTKVRGQRSIPERAKGDLFLVIRVAEDPRFKRKDNDLYRCECGPHSAVLGGEVTVSTLSGEIVLTIPAGTQPGQTFRLAEEDAEAEPPDSVAFICPQK
jgi:curved DNA-binding protein